MARPKVEPQKKRTVRLACVCTQAEAEELRGKAKAAGVPVSDLLRSAALGKRLPPPAPRINQESWVRLGKALGGLAAVAAAARSGQAVVGLDEVNALTEAVAELRKELL
jgi:hypothetical protein